MKVHMAETYYENMNKSKGECDFLFKLVFI